MRDYLLSRYLGEFGISNSKQMTENEMIWNKLKTFRFLNSSLNQSIIENRLPFGMKRHLTPLNISEPFPILKPSDFIIKFKDPNLFKRIEPRIEANCLNKSKFKFIPHKIISTCDSFVSIEEAEIKFDPSAILFFNPKDDACFLKTNLTSNANGSVSNDKNQLAAILKQSCWILSFNDLIRNLKKFNLPQIQNNKLRSLKYVEFISNEWKELKGFGEEIEFISLTRENENNTKLNENEFLVLKSKKNFENLNLFLIGKEGNLKFSTLKEKEEDFILISNSIYKMNLKIESGDTIFMIKSGEYVEDTEGKEKEYSKHGLSDSTNGVLSDSTNGVLSDVLKLNCNLIQDFEGKVLEIIKNSKFINSLIISRVKFTNEFDDSFIYDQNNNINYVSHLDTKMGMIVNTPIPGKFGSTTRHSVIYRSGYFAALHHDASKINRFPDTINYIIRKMGNPNNLGKRMEQEGEESVLKRISDIQYFAYLLKKEGKFYLALGGGSKCIILSNDLKFITVHEIPILQELPNLSSKDQIILLSPHFPPSILIKSLRAPTIQEWLKRLLQLSEVDLSSFKVSLGHFEVK